MYHALVILDNLGLPKEYTVVQADFVDVLDYQRHQSTCISPVPHETMANARAHLSQIHAEIIAVVLEAKCSAVSEYLDSNGMMGK